MGKSKSKGKRAAEELPEPSPLPRRPLNGAQEDLAPAHDTERERREQEALARKVTALQEFQDSDSALPAALAGDPDAGIDEFDIQQAIAALRRLPEEAVHHGKPRATGSSPAAAKRKGKTGRPPRARDDRSSAANAENMAASDIAIDPNLREAEGVVHEAPVVLSPQAAKAARSRGSGGRMMNAVLDDTGSYVLVPSLEEHGDEIEAGIDPAAAQPAKKKRARKHKSVQNNDGTQNHDDLLAEEVAGAATAESFPGQKRRSRGRPRKSQPEQSVFSARPEKRKADESGMNGSAEGAGFDADDQQSGPDGIEYQARPQKRMKASAPAVNGDNAGDASDVGAAGEGAENGYDADLPETGPLVKKEQHMLDTVLQQYRESRAMEQHEVNEMIQNTNRTQSEQTKELWAILYAALPQRPHVSVMRAARRRYHNYAVRGKWSAGDDAALREANEIYPGKWVKIGAILGRMPEDCRDRWRNYLACGQDRRTDDWSEKEERELKDAVQECSDAIRSEARERAKAEGHAFREQDWESMVNFNKVSEKMNHTRSRLQCYTHWRVMQRRDVEGGLASKKPQPAPGSAPHHRLSRALAKYEKMSPAEKFQILNEIAASNPLDEESINWKAITRENAGGKWTTRDRKETWNKLKQLIDPQETIKDTVDAISKWFTDRYIPEQLVVQEVDESEPQPGADDSQGIAGDPYAGSEAAHAASPKKAKKPRGPRKSRAKQKSSRTYDGAADTDADQEDQSGGETFHDAPTSHSPFDSATLYGQDIQDVHLARALQGIAQLSQERGELRAGHAE